MKEEYFEKNNKDSIYRKNYLSTIEKFLEDENQKAIIERHSYISPKNISKNKNFYKKEFIDLLGFPLNKTIGTAKLVDKIFVAEEETLIVYRLVFKILDFIEFYGILFEQKKENVPFVFALHGGGGTPETISDIYDSENYNSFARRIMKKGVTVFCPQLLLWHKEDFGGEEFDRKIIDGKLKQLGGSITSLELYSMISILNYFEKNSYVKGKIGVAGMSYGGMYSMYLSAIDDRFCSTLSSSFFNDRFKYSWSDWSYKNMARKFSDVEICALINPRALCISIGDEDEMFNASSGKSLFIEIQQYYKYSNNQDKIYCYSFKGKHEFDKQDIGIDKFVEWLK